MNIEKVTDGGLGPDERGWYRVGGICALVLGVAYVIIFPLFARVGVPPSGGEAWLKYLAGKTTARCVERKGTFQQDHGLSRLGHGHLWDPFSSRLLRNHNHECRSRHRLALVCGLPILPAQSTVTPSPGKGGHEEVFRT